MSRSSRTATRTTSAPRPASRARLVRPRTSAIVRLAPPALSPVVLRSPDAVGRTGSGPRPGAAGPGRARRTVPGPPAPPCPRKRKQSVTSSSSRTGPESPGMTSTRAWDSARRPPGAASSAAAATASWAASGSTRRTVPRTSATTTARRTPGAPSSGSRRTAWENSPPRNTMLVSPRVSMPGRYGWTIAVRPCAWSSASRATAPGSDTPGNRPVPAALPLTAGLTTTSPTSGSAAAVPPGARNTVGTVGTPARDRSPAGSACRCSRRGPPRR